MSKVEYPKMIYKGEGLTDHIVVKDREAHLIKQREGYHQHDGTLIKDEARTIEEAYDKMPNLSEEIFPKAENVPEAPDELKETKDESEFNCDLCGFSGKNIQSLRMHKMAKHGVKLDGNSYSSDNT